MAKKASEPGEGKCPLYALFDALCGKRAACGPFVEHLRNARVEVLLAVRGLIDRKIDALRGKGASESKARRIKVTEEE